jgi:hypothetical protein
MDAHAAQLRHQIDATRTAMDATPTQEGWIEPIPGQADVGPDRLPIHIMVVDAKSGAAHAVIESSGAGSVHLCT